MRFTIPKIQARVYYNEIIKAVITKKSSKIKEFEKQFSKLIGRKYCIATFSGRAALIGILASLDLHKGDEILMPGFTFIGIPHILKKLGYEPVFVDIDKNTLNINPDKIAELITKKTKALLLVHNLGNPNDMDKILKICNKHKIILIEDCAHTLTSKYKNQTLGTFGKVSFFSFLYSKIINTYWGGMACTDDPKIAKKIRQAINKFPKQTYKQLGSRLLMSVAQGIISIPIMYSTLFTWSNKLYKKTTGEDVIESLYKLKPQNPEAHMFKFTNFQAIIGLEQLKKLGDFTETRKSYFSIFKNSKLQLQKSLINTEFIPLMITAQVKNKKKFIRELEKHKIEVKDFYIHALTNEFPDCRNNCNNLEKIYDRIIYFPTFHLQKEKDIKYIIEVINRIYK